MSRLRRAVNAFSSVLFRDFTLKRGCSGVSTFGQETDLLPPRFLVTGAGGQIGGELVPFLQSQVGVHNVVASDIRPHDSRFTGTFVSADVTEKATLERIVKEHGISYIVHLASLLSAVGEKQPDLALKVNTVGTQNVLELARDHELKVYAPSTIAVFGPTTPKANTPDATVTQPTTMYGITKVHQELMGTYYNEKYGVDYRSLRYPGIISAKVAPGGGTTDYAVEIFHVALQREKYRCFLAGDTELPMMYMPDCIRATWQLMMAPEAWLKQRTYNVTAMSFTPEALATSLRKLLPEFEMECYPDFRQEIANTWPATIDDSAAKRDWKWRPQFCLDAMCEDMLTEIRKQRRQQRKVHRPRDSLHRKRLQRFSMFFP